MADSASVSALREVAAAIRILADTVQEPLLAVTSALSQAEATLASLDVQAVTKAEALPAEASPVSGDSRCSPLPASMDQSATLSGLDRSAPSSLVPRSPKSPSGQTTGRRLSQALYARSSKF